MSPSKPTSQPLRKTTATISILTFILALTTLITTSLISHPTSHSPSETYPLVASALATTYTLLLLILTLLPTPKTKTPIFHLTTTTLSASFLALFIGIIYLANSSALLPCTAGTTPMFHNAYVTRCQQRQTVFWSAVSGAVGFAVLGVLGTVMFVRARRIRGEGFDMTASTASKDGDMDSVSVAPPSYTEKDGDVEREGDWDERVRGAV